jgi:ABC-type bacteriocin/lantibiotic exporter with double-glycine peptidase domain
LGWFDEQIRQRKRLDDELFRDSYDNIAHKVLGEPAKKRDKRTSVKNAIDEVFYYYNYPRVEIPFGINEPLDQIEYAAGSVGIMKANIKLNEGWFTDCFGPIIGFFKEDNMPIALFPKGFAGYYYYDPDTGRKTSINKKTAALFTDDAVAFYEPLPLKELGIPDLLNYMKKRLNYEDYGCFAAVAILAVLVSMIIPAASEKMAGTVLDEHKYTLFMALMTVITVATIVSGFMDAVQTALLQKIKWKVTIPVEQAVMQRILTLPVPFFRKYSAGELSSRSSSINLICQIIIEDVFSLGFTSLISLVYVTQIFRFAPGLVVPSVVIMLATVVFSTISTIMQTRLSRKRMELVAQETGLTYAVIGGIQKIKLAGAEKRVFSRWANHYAEGAALLYNPPFFLKISTVINTGIALIGTVVLYGVAVNTGVTTSEYFAFNIAYGAMFAAFSALTAASLSVAKIQPGLGMAGPIF